MRNTNGSWQLFDYAFATIVIVATVLILRSGISSEPPAGPKVDTLDMREISSKQFEAKFVLGADREEKQN